MSKAPFKLRSGNSPLFKHMGSSPAKHMRTFKSWTSQEEIDAVTAHNAAHKNEAKVKTTTKKAEEPKTSGKVSYADAYAKADQALYGNLSLEEYTAEAKRQQKSYDAGKGWDAPTKPMTSESTMTTSGEGVNNVDTSKQSVAVGPQTEATAKVNEEAFPTTSAEVEPFKPLVTSRKERRQEKLARKSSGRLSKKEIKYEKLASKAETALAKGKTRKAKRLAKRASNQLQKKGVNTTDEGVGLTSDRLIDLGLG